jgi:putative membrane protein
VHLLISLLVNAAAVFLTAYVLSSLAPGSVTVTDPLAAVITAIVLGIVNAIIKPILLVLTFPITMLTLGLFVLVINALMVLLADALVAGFAVDGFLWAIVFSLVLSVVNGFLHRLVP